MKFSDVKGRGLNFLLVILAILLVSSFANETVTVWAQDGMDDDRLAAPASSIEYVDLNNWVWVAEGDANWVVEPGGRTVYQTVNSSSPCLHVRC